MGSVTKSTRLSQEKNRLFKLFITIKDKITEIKSQYPYTMKALLLSPEKTEARRVELEKSIAQLSQALEIYKAKIAEMLM